MAPARLDRSDELAGLDLRLFERIDDQAIRSEHDVVVNLAPDKHVAAGRIDMDAGLKPGAFEYGLAAAGDRRDDMARANRFFWGVGRYEFGLNQRLHLLDEILPAFGP